MKYNLIALACALLFAAGLTLTVSAGPPSPDTDDDGVLDIQDNCLDKSNPGQAVPGQADADQDGYGQLCDCDYDENGVCNAVDFNIFKTYFFKNCTEENEPQCEADHDCNGVINALDFNTFKSLFFSTPGASGQACAALADDACPDNLICP